MRCAWKAGPFSESQIGLGVFDCASNQSVPQDYRYLNLLPLEKFKRISPSAELWSALQEMER